MGQGSGTAAQAISGSSGIELNFVSYSRTNRTPACSANNRSSYEAENRRIRPLINLLTGAVGAAQVYVGATGEEHLLRCNEQGLVRKIRFESQRQGQVELLVGDELKRWTFKSSYIAEIDRDVLWPSSIVVTPLIFLRPCLRPCLNSCHSSGSFDPGAPEQRSKYILT